MNENPEEKAPIDFDLPTQTCNLDDEECESCSS
jgi:hypothetical protein